MKLKYRFRDYLMAIYVWSVVGAVIYSFAHHGPPYEATGKSAIMEEELAALLKQVGKVLDVYNSSKAGRLHMHRIVSDEGWSLQRLQDTLSTRGWQRAQGQRIRYCKDGIRVELVPSAGVRDKVGTNNIGMDFNPETIAQCRYDQKIELR